MTTENPFRVRLKGPPILVDGGMGTELYARGVYVNRCFDELNEAQPELVAAVHDDYLRAGAEVIETNTFGANEFKLRPYGYSSRVYELNLRGAQIARRSVEKSGRQAFVAGSIGPLGKPLSPLGKLEPVEARKAFAEQARGLIDGGVDAIFIETMIDPSELAAAVQAVRGISSLPIAAHITLPDWNEAVHQRVLERMIDDLGDVEIDVFGVNCSLGPHKLLDAAKALRKLTDKPLSIQPNAGELEWVEGRLICRATPEYFAEYAKRLVLSGVKIVGGCCGSTPDHVRAMSASLRAVAPELSRVSVTVSKAPERRTMEQIQPPPYKELSRLSAALAEGRFVYSVEVHPPRSPAVKNIIDRVKLLKDAGVDCINVPDGPRASARLSAMVTASVIQREAGVEAILHFACRDRNLLGMQSDLLGAEVLGLDNILCVTGDPPKLGDYPMATAVFDVDAIGLLRIADNLNHGLDLAGNPIPRGTTFHLGCGANPGAVDIELEIDRIHRKIENGARFIMTQPVFDEELFFRFLDRAHIERVPVLVGILPLASYRNAEFFHNEVPGMQVPQAIRDRLKPARDGEEAAQMGIEIAAQALSKCAPRADGAYIMPPFGRVEAAISVIERFKNA